MAPGSFLGLSLVASICLVGVVAQQYWVSPPRGGGGGGGPPGPYADVDELQDDQIGAGSDYSSEQYSDYVPYSSYGGYDGRPVPVREGGGGVGVGAPSSSEEEGGELYLAPGQYPIPGPSHYWEGERGRDGWGKGKKKKKKKKGKKKKKCKKKKKGKKKGKKGCHDKGGWGPVSVSTSGVQVGWKGWIPPVKGAGWGWFGEKSGHFSFTDKGGWGKRPGPHFPDPGPPTFIKHGPIHHKVIHQQKGWGGWGGGGGGGGGDKK